MDRVRAPARHLRLFLVWEGQEWPVAAAAAVVRCPLEIKQTGATLHHAEAIVRRLLQGLALAMRLWVEAAAAAAAAVLGGSASAGLSWTVGRAITVRWREASRRGRRSAEERRRRRRRGPNHSLWTGGRQSITHTLELVGGCRLLGMRSRQCLQLALRRAAAEPANGRAGPGTGGCERGGWRTLG